MSDPAAQPQVRERKKAKAVPSRRMIAYAKALITRGKNGKFPSKHEAALNAGYSRHVAERPADIENTRAFRENFRALFRTPEMIAKIRQRVAEGMDARETKFFQYLGEVVETHEVVNFGERRASAELAAKMGGLYKDSKEVSGPDNGPIETTNVGDEIERLFAELDGQ